jgi:hypothetical protein
MEQEASFPFAHLHTRDASEARRSGLRTHWLVSPNRPYVSGST